MLETDVVRRDEDEGVRQAVVRFAEGREDRRAHAGRVRDERTRDRSARSLRRTGSNIERVAVTHTGALDIKDIVGYSRLVLTTAAHDALVGKFAKETEVRWTRATSSSRR